jgi:hypothetical protein
MQLRFHSAHRQAAPNLIPHRIFRILRNFLFKAAPVLDKSKPETEPEQFIEKTWLREAKNQNLSNSLKTKDRVWGKFFIEKRT